MTLWVEQLSSPLRLRIFRVLDLDPAWVQYWANYGAWAVQQLQAARQGDVSVATSVPPAPVGGAPSPPAGGAARAAPVGVDAGGGPVVNPSVPQTPSGPGLLGVPMQPQ
jgi:hypothetical protein